MYDKAPFIFVSNSLDKLKEILNKKEINQEIVDPEILLFNTNNNANIISFDHSFINGTPQIVIEAVDPKGELSRRLEEFKEKKNATGVLPLVHILYGIGSDIENSSVIIETQLLGLDYTIDRGRVYTLTFGPNSEAEKSLVKVGKYTTTPIPTFAQAEGVSNSLVDFSFFEEPSRGGVVIATSFDNAEVEYSYENGAGVTKYGTDLIFHDILHYIVRNRFNNPNTLVLLPDGEQYLPTPYINDNIVTQESHGRNLSLKSLFKDYSLLFNKLGLTVTTKDIDFREEMFSVPTGGSITLEEAVEDYGPEVAKIVRGYQVWNKQRYLKFYGTENDFVDRLNSVPDAPKINFVLFEENNVRLKNFLLDSLEGTPLVGGTQKRRLDFDETKPLIICGDRDLLKKYIYLSKTVLSNKKLSSFMEDMLSKVSNKIHSQIIKREIKINDSLTSFFRISNAKNTFETLIRLGDPDATPTFSYGDNQSNIIKFTVKDEQVPYLEIIKDINNSFTLSKVKTLYEDLSPTTLNDIFLMAKDYIVNDAGLQEKQNILDFIDTKKEDYDESTLKQLFSLFYSLADNSDLKDDVQPVKQDITQKIENLLENISEKDRFNFQITIKTLPLFLFSGYESMYQKCNVIIREPSLFVDNTDDVLPKSFFDGEYLLVGFRHVLGKDLYSEFKLVRSVPEIAKTLKTIDLYIEKQGPKPTPKGLPPMTPGEEYAAIFPG